MSDLSIFRGGRDVFCRVVRIWKLTFGIKVRSGIAEFNFPEDPGG
jgi:hypothetical protein